MLVLLQYATSNLEYLMENNKIHNLITHLDYDTRANTKKYKNYSPNTLLAFITTDEYVDYQIALSISNMRGC